MAVGRRAGPGPLILRRVLTAAALAVAAAGCGSSGPRLPPATEPSSGPPLTRRPAGRVVRVGAGPEAVVADPRTGLVAVALHAPRIAFVDGRSGRVVRRVTVPAAARHLKLAAPGGPVLVPAEKADRLATVTLPRGRVRSSPVGHQPHDAVAAGDRLLVGNELGASVSVLGPGAQRHVIRTAIQPGGVAAARGGTELGVVSVRENVLELFDVATRRRLGRVAAGRGPSHVVGDGGTRLFVADTRGGELLAYRVRPRLELTGRVAVPGSPYGLAYDSRRRAVWVTATGRNRVVEVSAEDHPRVLRRYPTVRQADSVTVDSATGRVFVGGWRAGVLQLLDPR